MTIITYGGGEILAKVFESISMLFYGQGKSLIKALMILTASIGGFWVLSEAFFSGSGSKVLSRFFFPVIIVVHLLLLPHTTIRIEDITVARSQESTKRASITVDKVPFLLGKLAALMSHLGYKITQAIETVMHMPDDISYNKTGHIFGAENLLDATCYRIRNADLENNFRHFVHQCVFYDLALGKYSVEELKQSTQLWDFFSKNTSKVRGIMFSPMQAEGEGTNSSTKPRFCSCKEAIERMKPLFEQEKNFYARSEVLGRLPQSYQALTGLQQKAEDLISQQLVMNTITEDLKGGESSFAVSRAYTKQRETFHILGSLTAKSLITMRNVLEALIYAAFLFIAPASLLPNGMKFLTTWAGLVIWLQLWPPFFSILNYVMQIASQGKIQALFGTMQGLSFFTSIGLRDLYSDMHAVAGYLAASIPFITYAILKGGVGSFVHLASSIMSPAQGAASTAADEKISGNYSFGNVNWNNLQAYNATAFKRQSAPSISSGFFSEDTGRGGVTYSSDGEIFYRQGKTELRTSIQKSDTFTTALQESQQDAQTLVDTQTEQYTDSVNSFASTSASFIEHFATTHQMQTGVQQQHGTSEQRSINNLYQLAEKFGERYGLDRRKSMEALSATAATAGGGLNVFGLFKAQAETSNRFSGSRGASDAEVLDAAKDFVQTDQFQTNWQQYLQTTAQLNTQELSDESTRYQQDMQSSYQEVMNSQKSLQKSLTNLEQVSETISLTKSNHLGVQQNLDHAFLKWVTTKQESFDKAREIIDKEDTDPQKTQLIQKFVKEGGWITYDIGEYTPFLQTNHLKTQYQDQPLVNLNADRHTERKQMLWDAAEQRNHFHLGDIQKNQQKVEKELHQQLVDSSKNYHEGREEIFEKGSHIHADLTKEIHTGTLKRTVQGPRKEEWKKKIAEGGQIFGNKKFGVIERRKKE